MSREAIVDAIKEGNRNQLRQLIDMENVNYETLKKKKTAETPVFLMLAEKPELLNIICKYLTMAQMNQLAEEKDQSGRSAKEHLTVRRNSVTAFFSVYHGICKLKQQKEAPYHTMLRGRTTSIPFTTVPGDTLRSRTSSPNGETHDGATRMAVGTSQSAR